MNLIKTPERIRAEMDEREAARNKCISVDRQALLDVVRALDLGLAQDRLPAAMDALREPFFVDEITSGQARTDGSMNRYKKEQSSADT